MTDPPVPLDGAIVRFLLRVVDRFEGMVADPDALLANLKAVGIDDAAVTQFQSFLTARASDVSKLSTDLPKLLAVFESSNPDLPSLIAPVKDLWTVVTGLVKDAPKLTAPHMPQAPSLPNGDVLGQLVTMAVDGALREAKHRPCGPVCRRPVSSGRGRASSPRSPPRFDDPVAIRVAGLPSAASERTHSRSRGS